MISYKITHLQYVLICFSISETKLGNKDEEKMKN
jgi:hypothetical protein